MRLAAAICVLILLVAGPALAGKPAIDAKSTTETFVKPSVWHPRLHTEGFNAAVPPPGWTAAVVNTVQTWHMDTDSPYEGYGDAMCFFDDTYSGPQNEWLYYEHTMQAGDDCLVFWAQASPYWAVYAHQNYDILVAINDEIVWSFADDYDLDASGEDPFVWCRYAVPLGAYGVGRTITIALGYVGYDGAQGAFDALSIGECPPPPPQPCCPFPTACGTLDYNLGDNGFATAPCGGAPVWQWGVPADIPTTACDGVPVTHVLASVLGGAYPVLSGESVVVGAFDVTPVCRCLEICHFYDFEDGWDGGNVKVSANGGMTWTLVHPFGGYDGINVSADFPCMCVGNQEMFTGDSATFVRDCFDLAAYVGQSVLVRLDMGSDAYATSDLGWYVKWIRLGGEQQSPVEPSTWGSIKAMYR